MRYLFIGVLATIPYLLYLIYCIALAFSTRDAQSQVAAAFWSFPSSLIAFIVAHQFLDWLGPYGSVNRRIGEWGLLAISGGLQYFAIGCVLAKIFRSHPSKNTPDGTTPSPSPDK